MQLDNLYLDALNRVLAWDLPEEALPVAIYAEAGHLVGLDSEQLGGANPD